MRYKPFGKTGIQVSELSLGTWGIGGAGWGEGTNKKDSIDAIAAMLDAGVNLIDTAPAYNGGVAEQVVGEAIKGKRDKVTIVTKTGTWYVDGKYTRTLQRDKVIVQCEMSLKNLGVDCIDLYLIHWPDPNVPLEETMELLASLREKGHIRHIGASNFTKEMILQAEPICPIEVVQMEYSMISRSNEEFMKWAHDYGLGIMTYGSVGAGILTGSVRERPVFEESDNRRRFYHYYEEPTFSRVMELLREMDGISAGRGGVPLAQIAINWDAQKPFVDTAIVGVRSRAKALENAAGMDWALTEAEMTRLNNKIEALGL